MNPQPLPKDRVNFCPTSLFFKTRRKLVCDELEGAVLSTTTDACQITSTIGSTVRATAVAAVSATTAGAATTTTRLPNAAAAPPKCVTVSRDLLHHRPLPVIATKASNTGTYPRPPSVSQSSWICFQKFAAASGDNLYLAAAVTVSSW